MTTNPALADLQRLVGAWRMELHGASFLPEPDAKVAGSVTIEWIENGAFLAMRQGDWENPPPAAVWIIGRDDSEAEFRALYADERGVSRVYRMSLAGDAWRIWRTTPEFSQRFEATLDDERGRISGRWQKSFDRGTTWEHDFNLDYTRVAPESIRRS